MADSGNATSGFASFCETVRSLEKERGSRIWCMVHPNSHICFPTLYSIYTQRGEIGSGDKIEVLIHSGGGHPDIAYRVMKFLRRRYKTVNVLVPLTAKSAATLMCLGADRIYLGELADLGPIDIQIDDPVKHGTRSFSPLDEFKSLEYMREQAIEWMDFYATAMHRRYGIGIKEALRDSIPLVTELLKPVFQQIDPIEMGGYRRAIAISEEYANRMLTLTRNPRAAHIIKKAVWGYPAHDFCIDIDEAKDLGLPVERLPKDQDERLADALLDIERNSFHGFVPSPQPTAKPASRPNTTVAPAKAVRGGGRPLKAKRPGQQPEPRVNGSGRGGAGERVGT